MRPDSALLREEIFGPVLVLGPVEDFAAALGEANDTDFGLSSAVFTQDIAKAMASVRATQSGVVHINRETIGVEPHVPFGGIKGSSSMSREQGKPRGSSSRRLTSSTCDRPDFRPGATCAVRDVDAAGHRPTRDAARTASRRGSAGGAALSDGCPDGRRLH